MMRVVPESMIEVTREGRVNKPFTSGAAAKERQEKEPGGRRKGRTVAELPVRLDTPARRMDHGIVVERTRRFGARDGPNREL